MTIGPGGCVNTPGLWPTCVNRIDMENSSANERVCDRPTRGHAQGRRGTPAGYQAHRTAGEDPCEQCRDAHRKKCSTRWVELDPDSRDRRRQENREAVARYAQSQPESVKRSSRAYRQANREIIRAAKSKPCADCGGSFPYYVMQFDHIDELGEKHFNIGNIGPTAGRRRLLAEIVKCEVVCSNCHAERTHQRLIRRGRVIN